MEAKLSKLRGPVKQAACSGCFHGQAETITRTG